MMNVFNLVVVKFSPLVSYCHSLSNMRIYFHTFYIYYLINDIDVLIFLMLPKGIYTVWYVVSPRYSNVFVSFEAFRYWHFCLSINSKKLDSG